MSEAAVLPLRFQLGARTLAAIPRRLVRVALSLEEVMAHRVPVLPPAGPGTDGYLLTSLPVDGLPEFRTDGLLVHVRQRYTRHHVDLRLGVDGWEAGLSANTRAALKRKAKKLAAASGGTLDIRRYAGAEAVTGFHTHARAVSAKTYQERLLAAGLPEDPAPLIGLAGMDKVRAWLLFVDERAVAYLCCTAEGDTLRYDHVGHDPAMGSLSPGAVLQAAALRDLLGEGRFRFFEFTEGEGQHKRTLASGGTACVDLLLLRPTVANRVIMAGLSVFDRAVSRAKQAAAHPVLARLAKRVRR